MPAPQMRVQLPSDFEDITLYGPNEVRDKEWNRQRLPTDYSNNFSIPTDAHFSVASTRSTNSTPTLASDTSSLRSSHSSQGSPNVAQPSVSQHSGSVNHHTMKPVDENAAATAHNTAVNSGHPNETNPHLPYNRRKSVPTLVDNTSMASLTIKNQSGNRTRKQREMEFDADKGEDIWPGDSLMFNVPMSPALYAQQKMKHYQMNSVPSAGHKGPTPRSSSSPVLSNQHKLPMHRSDHHHGRAIFDQHGAHPRMPLSQSSQLPRTPSNPVSSRPRANSPLAQQIHNSSSTAPKRSSGLRNSIGSTREESVSPTRPSPLRSKDQESESSDDEEPSDDSLDFTDDTNYSYSHQEIVGTKQPSYGNSGDIPYMNSDLSSMFARNSCASGSTTSISGLDADASDLTLDLYELQEDRHRRSHGLSRDSGVGSIHSLSTMAMAEEGLNSLPSPTHFRSDDERSSSLDSGPDSRRSSLTRPENLPPKDPEEERKHLKEYEKLLKDAAVAEKKKQQKREEEAAKRAQQTKADLSTWNAWLAKGCKSSLSSDLKWRGLPEKVRPTIWNLKLSSKGDSKKSISNRLPPFQMRHNFNYIEKEIVEDSERIWPECAIFGKGRPFHEPLIYVMQQFMSIRKEVPYSFELIGIAALLLLQLTEEDSIRAMLSLLEPGTLAHSILTGNERIASANYVTFGKVFKSKFPQLSNHFNKIDLALTELLNPMIGGYFSTILPDPEYASRILDVYIFEGDSFLLRAALGLLRLNEAFLYGSKADIIEEIKNPRISSEDIMMNAIRDVTRK